MPARPLLPRRGISKTPCVVIPLPSPNNPTSSFDSKRTTQGCGFCIATWPGILKVSKRSSPSFVYLLLTISPSGHGGLLFGTTDRSQNFGQQHGRGCKIAFTRFLRQTESHSLRRGGFCIILLHRPTSTVNVHNHFGEIGFPPEKPDAVVELSSRILSNDLTEKQNRSVLMLLNAVPEHICCMKKIETWMAATPKEPTVQSVWTGGTHVNTGKKENKKKRLSIML